MVLVGDRDRTQEFSHEFDKATIRSKLIAMVTGLKEGGRVKCDRYWPKKEGER